MKKTIFSLIALFVALNITAQEQRYIEVVAQEEMEVVPDEFTFTFRLREKTKYVDEDKSKAAEEPVVEEIEVVADEEVMVEEAVEEVAPSKYDRKPKREYKPRKRIVITVEEQEKAIRKFLKENGLDPKSLHSDNSTGSYSRYYTVVLKNPKDLKKIIEGIDSIGASRLNLVASKTNNKNKYRDEMAMKALQHAKEKAKKMAAVYNAKLGDIISITEIPEAVHSDTNKIYDLIIAEIARKNRKDYNAMTLTYQVKVKFALK